MRCLRRNKVPFWYANYAGSSGGQVTFTKPEPAKANISAAKDVAVAAIFGTDINYDKVLCTERNVPFNENAYLWIDSVPQVDRSGNWLVPPDYVVKRIAQSLSSALVAVTKVNVSV